MPFLKRLKIWNLALALCATWLLLGGASLPAQAQTLTPFEKDGSLYVVQQPAGGRSVLNKLNRNVIPYALTPLAVTGTAPPNALNGLGYNRKDGFMYVTAVLSNGGLYRIGKTGANSIGYQALGVVSGLPNDTYFAGDISPDGYLYLSSSADSATSAVYRINLNGTGPYSAVLVTLSRTISVGDFSFGPNGKLYAPSLNGMLLYEITVNSASTSGTVVQTATTRTGVSGSPVIGTTFFDGANGLYAYDNAGGFYVIDIPNSSVSRISTATPVDRSDGASVTDVPEYLDIIKSAGAPIQVNARTFDIPYVIGVKNTSTVAAANVQVNDNLRATFVSGNPTITISSNPKLVATEQTGVTATLSQNFDGVADTKLFSGTDDYPVGAIVRVAFTARVSYATNADVPTAAQLNSSYVSSVAGTTFTNPGYTFTGTGANTVAVPPINAVTGEASAPGTVFPTVKDGDTPGGTGTTLPPIALEGRVYEDFNFGGGVGRAFDAGQGMAGVNNARIEIYNSAGAFVGATNSAADGTWSYAVGATGTYYARVVNASVLSTRTGSSAALIAVQTFRTNNASGATVSPITGEVGGRAPANSDAGAGAAGTTLNTTTFQLSGGATGQAQSVAVVTIANLTDDRVGLDFGFNFDTIVNTNDAGQGSLRQFVLNSNALSNSGLDQAANTLFDPVAGVETSIFQIPSAALTTGVGRITLVSGLVITGANAGATSLDGRTQTANVSDSNAGAFGSGGTVGVGAINLPTVPKPEIEINGPNSIAIGLDIAAGGAIVRNVSMWGFGTTGDSDTGATIRVNAPPSAPTLTQLLLGASAVGSGSAPVSPANYGKGDLLRIIGVTNGSVTNSLLGFAGGKGVTLNGGANNWTFQANEIRNNARDSGAWDGIDAQVAGTQIIENLSYNNGGVGIDTYASTGGSVIRNNTLRNNGLLNTPTGGESAGIRVWGAGNSVTLNISNANYGAGLQIQSGGTTLISQNSIFGNGDVASNATATPSRQIGIDLLKAADDETHGTSPFVTPNASGAKGVGGNGLLNFPVFTSQIVSGTNIILEGFAPAGASVEIFRAAPDPSGFGEGQTFAFTFTEGSAADTDTTTGNYDAASLQAIGYPAAVAALVGSETGARRFRITVPANGINSTTTLTATATVASQTSEFSAVTVTFVAPLTNTVRGTVYLDANRNGTLDAAETGANINNLFVKAFLGNSTTAAQAVAVDAATGAFSFNNLVPGSYTFVLDNNNDLTDNTPAFPAGFVGTESPNGTRQITVGNQTILSQNFGLLNGAQISGNVFEDGGAGTGPGIAGVKVNLTDANGAIIDTATTDVSGNFAFSLPNNLASGALRVVEVNSNGYNSVSGNAGTTVANGGTYTLSTDTIAFNYVAGSTYTGLKFGDSRGVTFVNEDAKTGPVGSSVVYTHVFTAQTSGNVTFNTTQLPSPANPNWNVVTYQDSNGNGVLDGADAIINGPLPVTAGTPITVFLKNFIPTTAANGAQDRLTITATFTPTVGPVQAISRSDLTTVAPSTGLLLTKAVDKATARSNDVLVYTITYRNTGAEPLTNLVINDATPAYTTFVSASNGTLAPGLTANTPTTPAVGGKGAVKWTFGGSLSTGQSGTVIFSVRVQ